MSTDGFAAGFFVFFILFGIEGLAHWIWAIVDVVRVPDDPMFKRATSSCGS